MVVYQPSITPTKPSQIDFFFHINFLSGPINIILDRLLNVSLSALYNSPKTISDRLLLSYEVSVRAYKNYLRLSNGFLSALYNSPKTISDRYFLLYQLSVRPYKTILDRLSNSSPSALYNSHKTISHRLFLLYQLTVRPCKNYLR